MTLLKDNDYKEINVALLSLEADIKNKITNFNTSVIDRQLAEINNRIDKINAGGSNNSSAEINDVRAEIENINSKLRGNSAKIESIEQKLSDIFSAENKVTDFNATTDSGIYYWVTDAANRPSDYGVLLVNKYDGGSSLWINQIAYGTNGKIYFRQNINRGNWTEWKAVAFEGETATKAVEVVDYGDTSRTVRIGYEGPGLKADKLLQLAGYTEEGGGSIKIKDVSKEELIKWLGIPRIKYADYQTPTQTFTQFQQVPIELSNFSSEVTPNNVLCFMVISWTGTKLIASADYSDTSGLKCALIALQAGTGTAIIRCVYMV